jgi:hypothetical protein
MREVVLEHTRQDVKAPTYAVTADSARWDPKTRRWTFLSGASVHMLPDDQAVTMRFAELRLPAFTETPRSC